MTTDPSTPSAIGINDPRHFEAIIESSDDAIISKTCAGIVTSWNPAAQRIFGWSAEEILGRHITVLFPADRTDEEAMIMNRIAAGEKVEHYDTVRQRRNGRLVHVSVTVSPIVDAGGEVVGFSNIARDITERVETQEAIWRLANFDVVTELPNRRLFLDRLEQALRGSHRDRAHVGVVFLDLNGFKSVNDTLGHAAGDELLKLVAERVAGCMRACDTVARMGGDEFTVLLTEIDSAAAVCSVIARIDAALRRPFPLGARQVTVSGSFGYALSPEHGTTADALLSHADSAMYAAKRSGATSDCEA